MICIFKKTFGENDWDVCRILKMNWTSKNAAEKTKDLSLKHNLKWILCQIYMIYLFIHSIYSFTLIKHERSRHCARPRDNAVTRDSDKVSNAWGFQS